MNRHRTFAAASILAVAIGLVLGFWSLGGPGTQRELAADQRRSEDLRRLAFQVEQFYSRHKKLPSALSSLEVDSPGLTSRDPVSRVSYGYQVTGDTTYQLCTVFNADTRTSADTSAPVTGFNYHPAGRHCFNLDATRSILY